MDASDSLAASLDAVQDQACQTVKLLFAAMSRPTDELQPFLPLATPSGLKMHVLAMPREDEKDALFGALLPRLIIEHSAQACAIAMPVWTTTSATGDAAANPERREGVIVYAAAADGRELLLRASVERDQLRVSLGELEVVPGPYPGRISDSLRAALFHADMKAPPPEDFDDLPKL